MSYKFSVVIPIHNRENYLRECLDSLVNQTIQNFDVFLVDDASSDGSKQICDEYETNRIKHLLNYKDSDPIKYYEYLEF